MSDLVEERFERFCEFPAMINSDTNLKYKYLKIGN